MAEPLRVGSLFAGIGGFDLGLERAGMETVWQVEQDPYRLRVLAKHFPNAKRFDDVCEVGKDELDEVEVICGGFPCQDLSLAGRGAGIDGARSGLWAEYARIICELRPRYVIVENVPALLGRGLGRVLGDLAASGYDAEWDCIPASALGAPHYRDRIWIVAYPSESGSSRYGGPGKAGGSPSGMEGRTAAGGGRGASSGVEIATGAGLARGESGIQTANGEAGESERSGGLINGHWAVEPGVGRVADGVPNRVDRIRSLGDALVPQIAEWLGRKVIDHAACNPP